MFVKVFHRDPFMSFFEDDHDDLFDDMDCQLSNLAVPLSVSPLELLAVREPLANKRGKDNQARGLKRKKTCTCLCRCQSQEEEAKKKESQPSPATETANTAVVESEVFPPVKKGKFEVNLNLGSCYKPGELKVKLSPDNRSLIIEGCHEESNKSSGGYSKVSSQMYQRIFLPKNVDVEGLKCDLNEKGVMCISAPEILPALEEKEEVRQIPVNVVAAENEKTKEPSNNAVTEEKQNPPIQKEVQENNKSEQVDSTA